MNSLKKLQQPFSTQTSNPHGWIANGTTSFMLVMDACTPSFLCACSTVRNCNAMRTNSQVMCAVITCMKPFARNYQIAHPGLPMKPVCQNPVCLGDNPNSQGTEGWLDLIWLIVCSDRNMWCANLVFSAWGSGSCLLSLLMEFSPVALSFFLISLAWSDLSTPEALASG